MKNVALACVCASGGMLAAFAVGNGRVAERVRADFADKSASAVWHYAVPPMSELQRLPDAYPTDGKPGAPVKIVAAKDEYEPGSFLVWARENLGKVQLEVGDLKNGTGDIFPKENLDLKFVKVWYQNRNAWFSYFGDTGFKLCPELLLNDEDLIRVDTEKTANYAKLTDADGKKIGERWINPPRQFDKRQLMEGYRSADTFQSMRPDFRDAKTLQPVTLPKEEFRQFFLTAHVGKDAKPGLYRGEVEVKSKSEKGKSGEVLAKIPVELRVLDFTLPQPKCFREPEKDFLVSSYSYLSLQMVAERNGYDFELARRQFVSVLRNQVEHNQTMYMLRGSMDNAVFGSIEAMKEAGMRTDVFQGGAYALQTRDSKALRAHAQRVADEFDRRYGHHNVYMGHGDEANEKWVVKERPVFEAYQSAGIRFFMASWNLFCKAGYFFDWQNAPRDACDGDYPDIWNKMGNATHVGWYAQQHVGSENPAFCRRQNGLGAYLTGYTALCNYAHHLGPYNDDSTTYKPMVLAYGTYDGVIDTIAWEGFREGVDDIRYATLLTDLARRAQKSADLPTRYLGGKAMQYLTMLDPRACDQDAVRGEMIRFIGELQPLVAPYEAKPEFTADPAAAKIASCRAEASLDAEIKAELARLSSSRNAGESNDVHLAVAKCYGKYGRQSEGGAYLEKQKIYFEAAQWYYEGKPEARERVYRKALAEGRGPDRARSAAFWALLPKDLSLMSRFDEIMIPTGISPTNTNRWRAVVFQQVKELGGNARYVWGERPQVYLLVYRHVLELAEKWGVKIPAAVAKNALWASLMVGDRKGAAEAAKFGLADDKVSPSEKYLFGLAAALASAEDDADAVMKAAKAFDATQRETVNKDRISGLCDLGAMALRANNEKLARGLEAFRRALYRHPEKKRYVVTFSDKEIEGADDVLASGAEAQPYDRSYGGNLDFLQTDVTTGSRAVGNAKEKLPTPTMRILADANGLHIVVRQEDPKAADVALGAVGNGSFEGYIAPGENTPYFCFMYDPARNKESVFNSTYPTFGNRPLYIGKDKDKYRFETSYREGEIVTYIFFSWKSWMQRVPHDGSVWDFENLYWNRTGNCAWNGTESIHGRSTWGQLEFRLTSAQRAKILKPLFVAAYRDYRAEKKCLQLRDGVFSFWADPDMGDKAFYEAKVKPLEERLDAAAKLITADMSDETVFKLEKEALPLWQDILFEIDRLRSEWLLERNVNGSAVRGDERPIENPFPGLSLCIRAPLHENVGRFCDFIRNRMAKDGYKTLFLRVNYNYAYESHPACRATNVLTRADAKQILAACRDSGIKLIPKANLFGHQPGSALTNGVATVGILKAYPDMDESRNEKTVRSESRRSICPRHPKSMSVALDIARELIAVFEADSFHFGCDEVFEIGLCERCRGADKAKLFADWVNGFARALKKDGIQPYIWADRVIDRAKTGCMDDWEASDSGTQNALALLDKDIVLCDWHYWVRDSFSSVDQIVDAGFRMWISTWCHACAARPYVDHAHKRGGDKVLGVMMTTWMSAESFLDGLEGKMDMKANDEGQLIQRGEANVYRKLSTGIQR